MSNKPWESYVGDLIEITINGRQRIVEIVDGEKLFNEPGISHGFFHFRNLLTGEKEGFAGCSWDKTWEIY